MTEYLLSIYQPDTEPPVPGDLAAIQRDLDAFEREARSAGAWLFAGGLRPVGEAAVVRAGGGDVLTTDGPYVEGKEHIGGFVVVAAADLDSALGWGGKLSRAATLPVEVREIRPRHA